MWQNLALSVVAGWVARARFDVYAKRRRAGRSIRESIREKPTNPRRVPRVTEVP